MPWFNKQQTSFFTTKAFQAGALKTLLFGAVVTILGFALAAQMRAVVELRNSLRTENDRLSVLSQKATTLQSVDGAVIGTQLASAESALPSQKPVFAILSVLPKLAQDSGVRLQGYNFMPGKLASESGQPSLPTASEAGPGLLSRLTFDVTVSGTLEKVLNFLDQLKNSLPLVEVGSAELGGGAVLGEEVEFNVILTLSGFYSLPPAVIGKVSEPLPDLAQGDLLALERLSGFTKVNLEQLTIGAAVPTSTVSGERANPFGF